MPSPDRTAGPACRLLPLVRGSVGALLVFTLLTAAPTPAPADTPDPPAEQEKSFEITDHLLLVPIRNGAEKAQVSLFIDGKRVRRFSAELAGAEDDVSFWTYFDLSRFEGGEARLVASGPRPARVELIRQGDTYPGEEELYAETWRPQFHFTSRRGWNNDPNGLVYFEGEWHLFYQHNPVGWAWDNMHWGHAVSEDLVHWRELGDTLFPWSDDARGHVFSGGGFVDWKNISGFQDGDEPPLVVAFTDTEAGESLAYSNDRGRTFTAYDGNPVVAHEGRDPKILWHEPTGRWVMIVYDESEERAIDFYSSADLKEWRFESRLPGFFECPELAELPIDGGPESRWVVFAADGEYVLGSFDGRVFSPDHEGKHRLWHGNFYASQLYSDAPDGRWVQIGWARGNDYPGMPFNQGMTVPVDLSLRQTKDGPRLFAEPISELGALREEHRSLPTAALPEGDNALAGLAADVFEIDSTLQLDDTVVVTLTIGGAKVVLNGARRTLRCGAAEAPLPVAEDGRVRVQVLVDRGSIEVFAGDGQVALAEGVLLPRGDKALILHTAWGTARMVSFDLWRLQSIWPER
ncbi:MAG: glycoside hydrolase family 32 protein [Acidobacteria bacterium]|nr:glycoside hydrolase family 32 protein [Acidobacteriota bacterium]